MNDETEGNPAHDSVAHAGAGSSSAPDTVPMLFKATGWSTILTLNRAGREGGLVTELQGTISEAGNRDGTKMPARVRILPKDAKLRLELVLAEPEARLTIPLDEFALDRTNDRLKELSAGFDMAVSITFEAAAAAGRQLLDEVEFRFEKVGR